MAVFFLVLLTDWRNTLAMILVGSTAGALLYLFTTNNPTLPIDYISRFPTFILIIIGGSLFKFSNKLIEIEKTKALTNLAGSIAHEMRNPLAQMKHSLDNIAQLLPITTSSKNDQILSSKIINEIFTHIEHGLTSSNRGLQVIDMTLREVSNQELNPAIFTYVSAAKVTEKALEEYGFESLEERKKVTLNVTNDFIFQVDETAYIYIIFNLLKNALYYFKSNPNASITISIDLSTITVTDTGPGIPEPVLATLFKNFNTAGKANGTGLGLTYCHRTMRAFQGSIRCESVVGQYTSFVLTFPTVTEEALDLYTQQYFQFVGSTFNNKRFLIVDDEPIYHMLARQMLNDLGSQVDGAENTQSAMDMLNVGQYDLIIMDIKLPGKDGYSMTEEIRSGVIPNHKNIAIVAHSSEAPTMAKIRALQVGMDGFVSKPCTQLELVSALFLAMKSAAQREFLDQTLDNLRGKTILIVDDESVNRQYIEAYTNSWGMKTLHADSGQAALNLLAKIASINFVIMDMHMPMMSGIETTERIRANPVHSNIIIVALTGNSSDQAIEESRAAGMNGFITKPIDQITLQQTLTDLLLIKGAAATEIFHVNTNQSRQPHHFNAAELSGNRYIPKLAIQESFFKNLPLIDNVHLANSKKNLTSTFQNFLQSMFGNLSKRNIELRNAADHNDVEAALEALHSLMGLAGYVGANSLRHYVKLRLYDAVLAGHFPEEEAWIETVDSLLAASIQALRENWAEQTEEV